MSSHLRPDPRQRAQRSATLASIAGVGLVVFGVVLSIWQKSHGETSPQTPAPSVGGMDGGVLGGLQQLVPTLAAILVLVIVVAGVVLFKGRRHQG